jgi:gluconolactonase
VTRTEPDGSDHRHRRQAQGQAPQFAERRGGEIRRQHLVQRPQLRHLTEFEGSRSEQEQGGCYVYRVDPQSGEIATVVEDL